MEYLDDLGDSRSGQRARRASALSDSERRRAAAKEHHLVINIDRFLCPIMSFSGRKKPRKTEASPWSTYLSERSLADGQQESAQSRVQEVWDQRIQFCKCHIKMTDQSVLKRETAVAALAGRPFQAGTLMDLSGLANLEAFSQTWDLMDEGRPAWLLDGARQGVLACRCLSSE